MRVPVVGEIGKRRASPLALGRGTVVLGAFAGAAFAAVVAVELVRVWRRGSAPALTEADDAFQAAAEAVVETAEVARTGYHQVSTRENAMFNLLTSFVISFVLARGITTLLRSRSRVGPFRTLRLGRRHIHHFVPGIVLGFGAGAGAVLTHDDELKPKLAVPFGVGMGLTLDESALLLELDDVYWSEEGVLSVQIALAMAAMLAAVALAGRFLRRGEQVVLKHETVSDGR